MLDHRVSPNWPPRGTDPIKHSPKSSPEKPQRFSQQNPAPSCRQALRSGTVPPCPRVPVASTGGITTDFVSCRVEVGGWPVEVSSFFVHLWTLLHIYTHMMLNAARSGDLSLGGFGYGEVTTPTTPAALCNLLPSHSGLFCPLVSFYLLSANLYLSFLFRNLTSSIDCAGTQQGERRWWGKSFSPGWEGAAKRN